jgi:hypothetical protein
MKQAAVIAALLLSLACLAACGDDTEIVTHRFKTENLGMITLSAPKDWPMRDKYDAASGTTAYEIETPLGGNFKFFMVMGDLASMKLRDTGDSGLEDFVIAKAAPLLPKTLEGRALPQRFGFKKDGVYVRLTDKTEKPKPQYLYLTQGVRLTDNAGIYFAFFSNQKNDQDEKQLKQALATVESIKVEPPPPPAGETPE